MVLKLILWLSCFLLSLSACSSVRVPVPAPLKPPTITLECSDRGATIQLSSPTPILTPRITIPRFPDGSIPVSYLFEDFTGLSKKLELGWCPVSVVLEYSRVAPERFTTRL